MEKKWFVGIDVSKKTLDCAILRLGSKETEAVCFQVQNDEGGFRDLCKRLGSRKIDRKQLVISMENTGMYCFELCCFLETEKIDYCVFNALDVKLSLGLVRGKSDKVDAVRLAYHTRLHRDELKFSHLASPIILHLKGLIAERKQYTETLAGFKNFNHAPKTKDCMSTDNRIHELCKIL